ncbi:sugar transferase [Flavobacteriaceae bacterium]|nr:sugar transferase [Flavobacteriaceae bacterium]
MNLKKTRVNFNISERKILLWLFDLLAITFTAGLLGTFDFFTYYNTFDFPLHQGLFLLLVYSFFAQVFEAYDLHRSSRFDLILYHIILAVSWTVLVFLMTPKITPFLPEHRIDILYFYLAMLLGVVLWRFFYINLLIKPWFYKWVILVAKEKDLDALAKALMNSDPHYKIIGFLDLAQRARTSGAEVKTEESPAKENQKKSRLDAPVIPLVSLAELEGFIKQHEVKDIVVANNSRQNLALPLYRSLLELSKKGISIRDYNKEYEAMNARVPIHHVKKEFYRFFPYHRANQNKLSLFFQRAIDLTISALGLLVFMPVFMILIGLLNQLFNRGPLFYTQKRVGRNGTKFTIYKFRTMAVDAEQKGPQYTIKDDTRVTWFGRLMRRLRIDEFPQLLNILKGEMNIIGPRPERPEFVKDLSEQIPFYDVRHVIKPGLTGWAQVNHNYGTSKDDALIKLQYDLYYIKNRSIFLDLSIYIKTLSTVLFMRGQ